MKFVLGSMFALLMTVSTPASTERPLDVGAQAKGAAQIVIARVTDVQPRFDVNQDGDRLIISQAWLDVEETLKGRPAPVLSVDVEGGTIGNLTLDVSDTPKMQRGQRAVFFLDSSPSGAHQPHGHGLGILMLDENDRVVGRGLSLAEIRAAIQSALR